jgi:protein TonB
LFSQSTPAQTQTARANTNAQSGVNTQPNSPAQPKPSPTPGGGPAPQPAAKHTNNASPVLLASLDKGAAPGPSLPVAVAGSGASEGGPAVKSDGEAPAQPVMRGPLKPISGGILNGKALNLPAPAYPDAAKRMRLTGTVEVEVVIDINGKVISAKAVKGPSFLAAAAEQAARLAKFTPTLLSGQPVKVSGIITYNFSLD